MSRFYVDTSAYLAVVLGEDGAADLVSMFDGAELLSSVLLPLEAGRSLVRLSRERILTPDHFRSAFDRLRDDLDVFALRDLTLDICTATIVPAVTTPRSLDLAHLRTALWFHRRAPITRFVSLDQSQLNAARELDLPT